MIASTQPDRRNRQSAPPRSADRRRSRRAGRHPQRPSPLSTVGGERSASAHRGYGLVVLVMLITVANVMVAAALPLWSTWMKREREEELIFRGLQYAEAIRVFQRRFGRLPVRIEELIEVEPRCIRQLWKDPMTDSTDWGLLISAGRGQSAATGRPARRRSWRERQEERLSGQTPENELGTPGEPGEPGSGPKLPTGPIQGVYSRSTEESIKTFFERHRYDQWQFMVNMAVSPGGGVVNPGAGPPRMNAGLTGRPFRVSPQGQQPGVLGPTGTNQPRPPGQQRDPFQPRRRGDP